MMDPNANLKEQCEIAQSIIDRIDAHNGDTRTAQAMADDAERLAELVLALDVWLAGGGFIPEAWDRASNPSVSLTYACPECGAEVDIREAQAL